MAKPAQTNHPLRQLRNAVGNITQGDLGEILGVSAQRVKVLERGGKNKLTEVQSLRLAGRFGVLPSSLASDAPQPLDFAGCPYSAKSLEEWMVIQDQGVSSKSSDAMIDLSKTWLDVLMTATRGSHFIEVKWEFDAWLHSTIARLDLDFSFNVHSNMITGVTSAREYSVYEVLADPELSRILDFPTEANLPGVLPVTVEARSWIHTTKAPLHEKVIDSPEAPLSVILDAHYRTTVRDIAVLRRKWKTTVTEIFVCNFGSGVKSFSLMQPVTISSTRQAKSPRTPPPKRASPKLGSAKKGATSRPGGPSPKR